MYVWCVCVCVCMFGVYERMARVRGRVHVVCGRASEGVSCMQCALNCVCKRFEGVSVSVHSMKCA